MNWKEGWYGREAGECNFFTPSRKPESTVADENEGKLQLSSDQYLGSVQLKEWVRKNKHQKYVPSDLLQSFLEKPMSMPISRRRFLGLAAMAMTTRRIALGADNVPGIPADLDHILLGANDLDHGIEWMQERSGLRALFGGVHPGRGTRNALLSLGPRRYLEIIAPDPQQASATSGNEMANGLRALHEPRLIGWAAHTDDLARLVQKAAAAGIAIEGPRDGSRVRPDGKTLQWSAFTLKKDFDGVLPFFIEWNRNSIHPSQDAPSGCTLQHFFIESPALEDVRLVAGKLGLEVELKPAKTPALRARIMGKRGAFEIT
ncbi:MAG TPA: VOC family protein [Candidatus Angelobacter sp.]